MRDVVWPDFSPDHRLISSMRTLAATVDGGRCRYPVERDGLPEVGQLVQGVAGEDSVRSLPGVLIDKNPACTHSMFATPTLATRSCSAACIAGGMSTARPGARMARQPRRSVPSRHRGSRACLLRASRARGAQRDPRLDPGILLRVVPGDEARDRDAQDRRARARRASTV